MYVENPPDHGYLHWHAGIDLKCDLGTPVLMPPLDFFPGRVRRAIAHHYALHQEDYGPYVTTVELCFESERPHCEILLAHLSQRCVRDGQELRAGQVIALTGSEGFSTGPHLHCAALLGPLYRDEVDDMDPTRFLYRRH